MSKKQTERNNEMIRLKTEEHKTFQEIGNIFEISRQRVEQIIGDNEDVRKEIDTYLWERIIKAFNLTLSTGMYYRDSCKMVGVSYGTFTQSINKIQKPKNYKILIANKRFWSNVDIKDGNNCWNWKGFKDSNGYGRITYKGKSRYSHRIMFEIFNKRKSKLLILHKCDNPSCCNPSHLYEGTPQDNINDREKHGRGSFKRKFTFDEAQEIRKIYNCGKYSINKIAKIYKISQVVMNNLIRGKTYKQKKHIIK